MRMVKCNKNKENTFPPNNEASYNLSEQRLYTLYFPYKILREIKLESRATCCIWEYELEGPIFWSLI